MFEGIQRGLGEALKKLRGRGRITEANVREALQEVRKALLDADVNFTVANEFIDRVTQRSVGQEVLRTLDPSEQIVRIVYDELVHLMGPVDHELPLRQGSADRHHALRPAGQRQDDDGRQAGAEPARDAAASRCWSPPTCSAPPPSSSSRCSASRSTSRSTARRRPPTPVDVCRNAVAHAKKTLLDTVILDTAGRLHIDEMPMDELKQIDRLVKPRRGLPRLRRHDRPGRRQQRQGVQRRPGAERRHPDQDGRRRPRRRGPVDQGSDQGADQVHRRRREAGPAGGVSPGGHGPAHPGPGRHHGPDREGRRASSRSISQEEIEKQQEKLAKGDFTLDDFRKQFEQLEKMGR